MLRRPLLFTVALGVVTGVTALVVVLPPDPPVAGTPTPYCSVLQLLFDTDEQMRRAAARLREDNRVREVRDERTKSQNHDRLTAGLREDGHHDLADASRVGTTPASLRVVEAFEVDVDALAGDLRREHRVTYVDVCDAPEGWDGVE